MSVSKSNISTRQGLLAISPIAVFLLIYLITSIVIGDFYKMPLSVAMLIASIWGAYTLKGLPLHDRIEVFSKEAGSSNVMYMIWIFILAGAFASIAKFTGAIEATVNITVSLLPSYLIVPGLFIATCLISMAIGTSVGTVVAMTPLAVEIANNAGAPVPYYVAIVLGGAFFGDNLSFISDTTIAATRTQECNMRDKFLANIWIVLPAALIALFLYCINAPDITIKIDTSNQNTLLLIPYLIVIVSAIAGVNVIVVLFVGILTAIAVGLLIGMNGLKLFSIAGEGIDSVGSLIIVTVLAAGMLGIIKKAGGIDYILKLLTNRLKSARGAQLSILLLVGIVNICTANNTVAIITVGSVARKISVYFKLPPRRSASLLDTGSCIVQALIPYGAQTLMATSLAGISPIAPWRFLFYPQILLLTLLLVILITKNHKK
ncbi:MAG: Na+/H+ antiporter NhaC family protein [Muribaculaceae bacterium]|nr:Na+/H+ antiporter NhaC family protein [Muribaculaceae bacterium]MDE6755217.1 Na+/H+ antiporter NhaC family protein [Muribaculaceae bacterium]